MTTDRWCLLTLLLFLSTEAFNLGVTGVLYRRIDLFPPPRKGDGCRSDWIKHRQQCYNINRNARLSRSDAKVACKVKGKDAQLADVTDKDTQNFLLKQMQDGVNDSMWVDHGDSGGPCDSLGTSPQDCTEKKGYICEELNKYVGCPKGYVGHGEWCYTRIAYPVTWAMGQTICQSLDPFGDLASVNSKNEYDFIREEFGGDGDRHVWIGLRKLSSRSPYTWSNGERVQYLPWGIRYTGEESRGYVTMDLRDTEFMPSASPKKRHQFLCSTPRVTDEIGSTQNLLDRKQTSREAAMEKIEHARDMDSEGRTIGRTLLDNRNNHYETIDPDDLSKEAIHIEKDAMNSKKIATGISNTCEKGWQIFGDDCYEGFPERRTFLEASAACRSRGAHLVSLHSAQERDFVHTKLVTKSPQDSYWIGLTRDEKGLRWSDGSPLDYTLLAPRVDEPVSERLLEPGRGDGIKSPFAEECFAMDGLKVIWRQLKCDGSLMFICRKPAGTALPTEVHIPTTTATTTTIKRKDDDEKKTGQPELSPPVGGGFAKMSAQDEKAQTPPDSEKPPKTPVCPGTQRCGPRETESETGSGQHHNTAILTALVSSVVTLTVVFGGVSWYRQYGNLPFSWSRLSGKGRSSTDDTAPLQKATVEACLTLSDSDNHRVDGNQSNLYGTINFLDSIY